MSVIDPYTHMEEAWKLDANPFPSEGIRRSADEPFSPAVFPEETADFYRKLVRGAAVVGSKGIGFLWSQGIGGDTGYGKTTLMQTASREINRDLGATVLQSSGVRTERLVAIAAVYTNLNNLNATGLYPVLFDGVVEAATPPRDDSPLFDKARRAIADRVGGDANAIAADLIAVRRRIAPNGVPLRPELVSAFASGGADALLAQLSTASQAARLRNGLQYFDFLLTALAAGGIDHLFVFVDQLEDLATNKSINSAKRSREIGRIRDLLEGAPYAGRVHFVFTFHNTAAQVLERFWSVNRLPRFEIAPDNTASVVVLRGLSNDDQVAELLKVYITDKRLEHIDDELLPFEPDTLAVLRRVPKAAIAAARARVERFPLAPSTLIWGSTPIAGAGFVLTALFSLVDAWPASDPADQVHVLERLRTFANALGAEVPGAAASLGDVMVSLPGTRIRESSGGRDLYAECLLYDPTCTYAIDQVHAVIAKEPHA